MSFMFKGPASLTTGSVIDAVNVTSDNMTVDVDLTVGGDLTVTDDLTVSDVITTTLKFSSVGTATSLNQGNAGDTGDGCVLASKSYVDDRILASNSYVDDKHKVVNHSIAAGTTVIVPLDISNVHVLFLNTTSYTGSNNLITFVPHWISTVSDGHRIFISWVALSGTQTSPHLKIDFTSNRIQGGSTTLGRYLNLMGLHSNALIYYSATSGKWYSVESSTATITTI